MKTLAELTVRLVHDTEHGAHPDKQWQIWIDDGTAPESVFMAESEFDACVAYGRLTADLIRRVWEWERAP